MSRLMWRKEGKEIDKGEEPVFGEEEALEVGWGGEGMETIQDLPLTG